MKITVNRAALCAALETAKNVADTKSTMPVLACVHLSVKGRTLTVTATDLNLAAVTEIPCAGEDGTALVSAKELHSSALSLSGDEVRLHLDGTVLVASAKKATHKLATRPAKEWVKVQRPPGDWTVIAGDALAGALRVAAPAICGDETRFHLNGVLVIADGKQLRTVATDGHRLHAGDRAAAWQVKGPSIVPRKAVREIIRLVDGAGDVKVERDGGYLHVLVNSGSLSAKLIDAQFPPYEQVIPLHEASATIDRPSLLDACKSAMLAASEAGGIKLTFAKGSLVITSSNQGGREVHEELEIDCERRESMTVGVNPKYLVEALTTLGGDAVTVRVGGELDPLIVHRAGEVATAAAGDLAVIMPMRV